MPYEMDKREREIVDTARFLIGQRHGPFDQREQQMLKSAAALIGDSPVTTVDRAVCDAARRFRTTAGEPHPFTTMVTPFDLPAHDLGEALAAARRAELDARQKYTEAHERHEAAYEAREELTNRGFLVVRARRHNITPDQVLQLELDEARAKDAWREKESALARVLLAHNKILSRRDAYRVEHGSTFAHAAPNLKRQTAPPA